MDPNAEKAATTSIVNDFYSIVKQTTVGSYRKWKIHGGARGLGSKLRRYRNVKTILNLERSVDLTTFYHPTLIKRHSSTRDNAVVANTVDVFGDDHLVLLVGYVGQGKSILMRYLASNEVLSQRKSIPVFVELRRIGSRRLEKFLIDELNVLGLEMTSKLFRFFCEKGKFVLFLDGFDEIETRSQGGLSDEISDFGFKHPNIKIVVSSRPGTAIVNCVDFVRFDLVPLKNDDYKDVIVHMTDPAMATAISQQLASGKSVVSKVLTSPLMVALLVVRFKIDQTVPENEMSFFSDLFDLLMRRHDTSKALRRKRRSGVGDHNLIRIFNGVSFLSRKERSKDDFSINRLYEFVSTISQSLSVSAEPDKIALDFIQISNLILEEGGACRYVHKSIQEFHAACFVKMLGGEFAGKFYPIAYKNRGWDQELVFLKSLDKEGFEEHLLLPLLKVWTRKSNVGPRWMKSLIHDVGSVDRLGMILDGYVGRELCSGDAFFFHEALKKCRKKIDASVKRFKAIKSDFGL